MTPFLQQVYNLLTTETASLLVHLVLGFTILGTFQASLVHWQSSTFPQGRRMVIGLGLLLVLRLVLFAISALAWQGLVNGEVLMPPVDRAIILISLVLIIWMWAFPERNPAGDAAAVLLVLLTISVAALGIVWWAGESIEPVFNGSMPDRVAEASAVGLIGIGLLLLLVRRPNGWGVGVSMLGVLLAGHLAHLLIPPPSGNYSGAVRLAQMAAFPLLFWLPYRFPVAAPRPAASGLATAAEPSRPNLLPLFLQMSAAPDAQTVCLRAAKLVSQAMVADICLIVRPDEEHSQQIFVCGHDSHKEAQLSPPPVQTNILPVLVSAVRKGRSLRLPASSTSPDLAGLANLLSLPRAGHLLEVAVPAAEGGPYTGFVLLSPYSGRGWTAEDETNLAEMAAPLAQFLHRNQSSDLRQGSLSQAQQELTALRVESEQARREKNALQDQVSQLQAIVEKDQTQLVSLAAMIAAHEEAQELIARLQTENAQLQEAARLGVPIEDLPQAGGDFADTQEELMLLRTALAEAEQKILALKSPAAVQSLSNDQTQEIISAAQELRQPLSAISGYTDFLLGESTGILGNLQRKFLEKIRVSTERMGRIVDDLIQLTALEISQAQLSPEKVDLGLLIDEAIASTGAQLRQKNIILRVEMPERLPFLNADPQALQKVFVHLLRNAGAVTQSEGVIWLRTRIETSESEQDYVLVQIADEGGGIPPEDLPRVFSPRYLAEGSWMAEMESSDVSLAAVKSLVEALGGRIWVDNEPGRGSSYSVLLPVSAAGLNGSNPGDGGSQPGGSMTGGANGSQKGPVGKVSA